jgi:hypothetical protein
MRKNIYLLKTSLLSIITLQYKIKLKLIKKIKNSNNRSISFKKYLIIQLNLLNNILN